MSDLLFAIPSKGRLKEQTEVFLKECGLKLVQSGGDRGYRARLKGLDNVQVLLLSAREISEGLLSGAFHIGVTGEDLLREGSDDADARVNLLKPLGFGFARLVVAVPNAWVDVNTMADLEEAAALFYARHGYKMRVATKYHRMTRNFFARKGVTHHQIVDSAGATEAAPASGSAELIVDITTTGATLNANGLRILNDGDMLQSEATLTASRSADWSEPSIRESMNELLDRVHARAYADEAILVHCAGLDRAQTDKVLENFSNTHRLGEAIVIVKADAIALSRALVSAGAEGVSTAAPDFLFLKQNPLRSKMWD